ncbi:MAG: HAD family hydrolase [Planctomycetota bacterium]
MTTVAIFDLDDTLVDTTARLVPEALRRTAEALGVPVGRLNAGGKTVDEVTAPCGPLDPAQLEAAARAWYDPVVPELAPAPGARELLGRLRGRMRLVLLTRGDPQRQSNKIDRAGLRDLFDEIVIRSSEEPGSKADDLQRILSGTDPKRSVVIGDDPNDELRYGAALGCLTIDVRTTPLCTIEEVLTQAGLLE